MLNLSYGTGRAFIVPNKEVGGNWQGAVCELPMSAFATGIMRGRFAADGALHTCGMLVFRSQSSRANWTRPKASLGLEHSEKSWSRNR